MNILVSTTMALLTLSATAWAGGSRPSIEFSERERQVHNHYADFISENAATCLQRTWAEHVRFYRRWGVSKFYGDRNPALNTPQKRLAALRSAGVPDGLLGELEPTSCIGLTRQCLGEAFRLTENQEVRALWKRIDDFVLKNDVSGIPLVNSLQGLGWTVMYWNPQPALNQVWDREDVANLTGKPVRFDSGVRDAQGRFIYHPGWGVHQTRFNEVMRSNMYHTTSIDDKYTLVNFGTTVPKKFTDAPFFVGVAHAGYHVFPGFYGSVIEAHSSRPLNSIDNLQNSFFNPLASGGGPRWSNSEKYRSGMVAVPPHTVW